MHCVVMHTGGHLVEKQVVTHGLHVQAYVCDLKPSAGMSRGFACSLRECATCLLIASVRFRVVSVAQVPCLHVLQYVS